MKTPIPINPEVLIWARERSGLSPQDAAERLKRPLGELERIESGDLEPQVGLIKDLARIYHVPLAALLLASKPSSESLELPDDFRTIAGRPPGFSPETIDTIRSIQERLELVTDLGSRLRTVGLPGLRLAQLSEDIPAIAARERRLLGITNRDQRAWRNTREAFRAWRTGIEDLGVFVFIEPMPTEDCRGFSLGAETSAPAIVINSRELPQARLFTLLHEYSHLLLRQSAICLERASGKRGTIERFCNRFAAHALMPDSLVGSAVPLEGLGEMDSDAAYEAIGDLAREFKVSRTALIIRLIDFGLDLTELFTRVSGDWDDSWRPTSKGSSDGGRFEYILLSRLGTPYVNNIFDALAAGRIKTSEASELLGCSKKAFPGVRTHARSQARNPSDGRIRVSLQRPTVEPPLRSRPGTESTSESATESE